MSAIKQNSAYLENERSIPLYPTLAHTFGVQCAIILQQIRYWMQTFRDAEERQSADKRPHYHEGRWWVYNTYEQWQADNFGFWSKRTIQRHISTLEEMGVLISAEFNKSTGDRTKWYSIDFDKMDALVEVKLAELGASRHAVEMVSSTCPDHSDNVALSNNKESESTTETTHRVLADTPDGGQQDEDEAARGSQPKRRKRKQKEGQHFSAAEMTPVKDAIVDLFGWSWDTMTPDEKGQVETAAHNWLAGKGQLSDLPIVYQYCRRNFKFFKPTALTAHKSEALTETGADSSNTAEPTVPGRTILDDNAAGGPRYAWLKQRRDYEKRNGLL